MVKLTIKPLFKRHEGQDIYVLGSGASLGFVQPSFFSNKIVIAVNHTVDYIKDSSKLYVVAKEPSEKMQDVIKEKNALLICPIKKFGAGKVENKIKYPGRTHIFQAKRHVGGDKDQLTHLELSGSTIVSGIHFAAFLGAKNIILVGHDCGSIDDEVHIPDYDKSTAQTPVRKYPEWMKKCSIEQQTINFKQILREKWNINVYSLNPFINYNLEGHIFKPF